MDLAGAVSDYRTFVSGKGDDGDIMIASRAGGQTRYGTLFDHSAGSVW
jgi:hypothetical protein